MLSCCLTDAKAWDVTESAANQLLRGQGYVGLLLAACSLGVIYDPELPSGALILSPVELFSFHLARHQPVLYLWKWNQDPCLITAVRQASPEAVLYRLQFNQDSAAGWILNQTDSSQF